MSEEFQVKLPLELQDIKISRTATLPARGPSGRVRNRPSASSASERLRNDRYFIAGPGGLPMMPATILTEAMAQVGAVLILAKPRIARA